MPRSSLPLSIEIRLFSSVIDKENAIVLKERNGIIIPEELIEKNGGFKFTSANSRTCTVHGSFKELILFGKSRLFINPNYLHEGDYEILESGEITLNSKLPPERVIQLFLMQLIADSEKACNCNRCISIAQSNAAL